MFFLGTSLRNFFFFCKRLGVYCIVNYKKNETNANSQFPLFRKKRNIFIFFVPFQQLYIYLFFCVTVRLLLLLETYKEKKRNKKKQIQEVVMDTLLGKYLCTVATIGLLNLVVYVTTGAYVQTCELVIENRTKNIRFDVIRQRFGSNGSVVAYIIAPILFFPVASFLIQFCCWNTMKRNPSGRGVVLFMCLTMYFALIVYGLALNRRCYATWVFFLFFTSALLHGISFMLVQLSMHKVFNTTCGGRVHSRCGERVHSTCGGLNSNDEDNTRVTAEALVCYKGPVPYARPVVLAEDCVSRPVTATTENSDCPSNFDQAVADPPDE